MKIQKTKTWYFTFMPNQGKLSDKYIKIEGTYQEALSQMIGMCGSKFDKQYSKDEFLALNQDRKLTEIFINN